MTIRTVICHFYNEAYLLPWWLKHHRNMFDFGIMIDHGSTDESANICRQLVPHWKLVRTRLHKFDAFLNDLEVMEYERTVTGWKIVLNVTEFFMLPFPISHLENTLLKMGKEGITATGVIIVDNQPGVEPEMNISLPLQKHFGIEDNEYIDVNLRHEIGLPRLISRNRFYHCNEVGMYQPGRHSSYHQDANHRADNIFIFHFGYAPWTERGILRKQQIGEKVSLGDLKRNWGIEHIRNREALDEAFFKVKSNSKDLSLNEKIKSTLEYNSFKIE